MSHTGQSIVGHLCSVCSLLKQNGVRYWCLPQSWLRAYNGKNQILKSVKNACTWKVQWEICENVAKRLQKVHGLQYIRVVKWWKTRALHKRALVVCNTLFSPFTLTVSLCEGSRVEISLAEISLDQRDFQRYRFFGLQKCTSEPITYWSTVYWYVAHSTTNLPSLVMAQLFPCQHGSCDNCALYCKLYSSIHATHSPHNNFYTMPHKNRLANNFFHSFYVRTHNVKTTSFTGSFTKF